MENSEGDRGKQDNRKRKREWDDMVNASDVDEDEMIYVRGASPTFKNNDRANESPRSCNNSYTLHEQGKSHDNEESDMSVRRRADSSSAKRKRQESDRKGKKKKKKYRSDKHYTKVQSSGSDSICVFFMKGKCHKGAECPFSHNATPFRKMELCKFYLMDCCTKKDRCLFMHSDFPCKFYHMGTKCFSGSHCKFSHSELTENTRQILLKHMESLQNDVRGDLRHNNFEKPKSHTNEQEKIRRAVSQSSPGDKAASNGDSSESRPLLKFYQDTLGSEERHKRKEGRHFSPNGGVDSLVMEVANGQERIVKLGDSAVDCHKESGESGTESSDGARFPVHIPKKQQELFLRIQQQQREASDSQDEKKGMEGEASPREEDWYSSDEEDSRLTSVLQKIAHADKKSSTTESSSTATASASQTSALDINISETVCKLLSSIRGHNGTNSPTSGRGQMTPPHRDPRSKGRTKYSSPASSQRSDTHNQKQSTATINVYGNAILSEVFRNSRLTYNLPEHLRSNVLQEKVDNSDVDLRKYTSTAVRGITKLPNDNGVPRMLNLPFKPVPMHTPATEIYASFTSHVPMPYEVIPITIPTPDYSNFKFRTPDPQILSDPRLRKLYMIDTNLVSGAPRYDPRRRDTLWQQ